MESAFGALLYIFPIIINQLSLNSTCSHLSKYDESIVKITGKFIYQLQQTHSRGPWTSTVDLL